MRPRLLILIAALLLGCLRPVGAGCGSDDEEEPASADSSSSGSGLELISDGTLTVGSDTPYPPFEFGDPPDYEGFDIDLINAIAEDQGLEVEIVDAPFDVILAGRAGRFDLSIAATTITDARENRVDFSDPYFESEQSLLVQEDGAIQSIDDITADTVVGAEDGTTGETYANENTDAEVRPFPNIDDAFNALVAGQVEAVFNDLPVNAPGGRGQGGPRRGRDVPDRRGVRDRLPRGLDPGRADQRVAAEGQGRRHPRRHLRGVVQR